MSEAETDATTRTSWYVVGFAQDDYTVRSQLTLNFGLRWETDTPIKDENNRMNGFDAAQINPVSGTPGAVKFMGVNGFRTTPYDLDLAELDRLGLRDKTIVVFTVDHGYQLGEKGKWSKAGSLFEMGTRVPLIIDAPGMRGNGQVVTRIVQSLDIYPTLVQLSGLNPPSHGLEGRSLVPLLNQPNARWNHPAFSIWSEDGSTIHGTAVRDERWRYAEFGEGGKNGAMLFDEHADPLEIKNLVEDPQYANQRARLSDWIRRYAAQEIA